MLTVGIPEGVDRDLHRLLPDGIALEAIPMGPQSTCEVEFWLAPLFKKHAQQAWPFLRGVRVVQSMLAGVDGLRPLLPPDVVLCDARGVHDIPAAEWAVAAILASLKYFPLYGDIQHSALWKRRFEAQEHYAAMHPKAKLPWPAMTVEELHGKRVLIVGYGSIGHAIEERLQPFGVRVDRIARSAREGVAGIASLPELLPVADIVILSVPLTSETAGLVGAREIARMQQGALLVNVARGPIVDTDALLTALRSGRIRAAMDVTDPEPLPDGHPLWSAPNLLLTPHIAGSTPMFMRRAMELAAAQIGRYLRGEVLQNIVTGEY
ncbi:MAG TPA: 2-hydroxyacid dehydrogenase [Acidobacteriaceae bacterium]